MKHRLPLFFLMLLVLNFAAAQEEPISTDRPSETATPTITPKGFMQAELGVRKEQINRSDYKWLHPNGQLRYGLSKKWELRADISSASEQEHSKGEFNYGLKPLQVGFKTTLLQEKGALPQTAFYTMIGLPTWASKDHQVPHLFPQLRLLMENTLSKQLELEYNIGAEWKGEESTPQWMVSVDPQLSLNDKWLVFTEAYGKWQKGHSPEFAADAGFGYFLSRHAVLDVMAGKGLSHEAPDYFIEIGFSFRFKM